MAAVSKVFRKASLSLMKEQFSRLEKSAAFNIFSYFVSFWAFSSGILNKSIECVSPEIFPCDDLCGESASFTEQFNDVSPVLSVEIS